jgi:ribosomal-protein-alanine N-acetyltransferase
VYPVELRGPTVLLREFDRADRDAVRTWVGDPDAVRFVPLGPLDAAGSDAYLAALLREGRATPRDVYTLAVVEHGVGPDAVGAVVLTVDSAAHRRAEVGFILRREVWGRGLASEAAALMVDFGLDRLGFNRLWAVCDPENPASAAVLRHAGLRQEGHLRQDLLVHGEWRDSLLFAVIAADRATGTDEYA